MALTQLKMARTLEPPSREATLHRTANAHHFWNQNKLLLSNAWQEWEESEQQSSFTLDESLLDEKLQKAVAQAWQDPTKEHSVKELWQEISPGVFHCQFFNPDRLVLLRDFLERAFDAKIPLKAPYGIALNRGGAMLDPRSEGFLAAPSFQKFYRQIMDIYMRPIARLLFPEVMGFDTQTFGFSIRYQADVDTSLRLHTDASAATLNINLNLPDEEYTGSGLDFYNAQSKEVKQFSFKPGCATLHRGNVPHAAKAITSGERTNIVLWLYGDQGAIPYYSAPSVTQSAQQRWTIPAVEPDLFAPF